jgi:WD40 repeat protein
MSQNPFPGPQPYRAADRARFFGRDALVKKLAQQVLARPATTVFGPSGAGKSSLMQAGVIPRLEASHAFRVVRVDAWPTGEAPLPWLVRSLFADLGLGAAPDGAFGLEALDEAMALAQRRSDRPVLLYLDQLEQLFFPDRAGAEAEALLEGLDRLAREQHRDVHLVLSLREDYLGRFRDRMRERAELLAHGLRVGPLSVGEMVKAMCRTAAEGDPAQRWEAREIEALMLEVRVPGLAASEAAEVQTAFGQIVCRALWEQRGGGAGSEVRGVDAEGILHRYLDATVEGLGGLQEGARRLLEEHLVDDEGHRRLLTEKEARLVLPGEEAAEVLGRLERAAVLRAEEHQGSRYFELGHDWLAKKVFERRVAREAEEAERRRREEEAERSARERRAKRRLGAIAALSVVVAAIVGVLGVVAWWKRDEALRAQREASAQAARARDAVLTTGARELLSLGKPALASGLLFEVSDPARAHGWMPLALEVLAGGLPKLTLSHADRVTWVEWSPDGKRIVTASEDKTARVWNADGSGAPLDLKGHDGAVARAVWSPEGSRIVTASADKTARVWNAGGTGDPVILDGHQDSVLSAAWSPDGKRIVTASADKTARVWGADGSGIRLVLEGHGSAVLSAAFSADGSRIVTTSDDGTERIWDAAGADKDHPLVLRRNERRPSAAVMVTAAFSPAGGRVVSASSDGTAWLWRTDGSDRDHPLVLVAGTSAVEPLPDGGAPKTSFPDPASDKLAEERFRNARMLFQRGDYSGSLIEFLESDRLSPNPNVQFNAALCLEQLHRYYEARDLHRRSLREFPNQPPASTNAVRLAIARLDGVLGSSSSGHSPTLFSADGRLVLTAIAGTAWVWQTDGSNKDRPLALRSDGGTIVAAAFSADGKRVITSSNDKTAEVWTTDGADKDHPLVLRGHTRPIIMAAFSPDGGRVLTASADATARLWLLTLPDVRQALHDATAECLAPSQRATYLDESEPEARAAFEACERRHDRTPRPADTEHR